MSEQGVGKGATLRFGSLHLNVSLFLVHMSRELLQRERHVQVQRFEFKLTIKIQVPMILFLNKVDLLKAKLRAGVELKKYITTYTGENDFDPVSKCTIFIFIFIFSINPLYHRIPILRPGYFLFSALTDLRGKFEKLFTKHCAADRVLYVHLTSVVVSYS